MAENHSTKLLKQLSVSEIADRLQAMSAQLTGFKPILSECLEDVDAEVGNSLSLLGGMADYLAHDLLCMGEMLGMTGGNQS